MIGTQIGPFVLLRLLGEGGMGRVYLAEHSLMKDLHAIKVLDPRLMQNPQLVTRFVNEARATARLKHRNLIRVHNIDRVPDGGPWYMVLDFLDGCSLASFMQSDGTPIAPHQILHVLSQVANCIQHVHEHEVVHRDLKPDNIFLIKNGEDSQFPVVLDLGIAQLNDELALGPATCTGTVLGTPIYMAPEQLRGERVSAAADVFALGLIAYEMTTGGCFPYQYDESRAAYLELPPTELYFRQRSAPPVDPRQRVRDLDEAWVRVLLAALELDPRKRPCSARAFALMLAHALHAAPGHPSGAQIVRRVARELLHGGGLHPSEIATEAMPAIRAAVVPPIGRWETGTIARAANQVAISSPTPVRPRDLVDRREPFSTLDDAAAQTIHLRRGRRHRPQRAAALLLIAAVFGLVGVATMLDRLDAEAAMTAPTAQKTIAALPKTIAGAPTGIAAAPDTVPAATTAASAAATIAPAASVATLRSAEVPAMAHRAAPPARRTGELVIRVSPSSQIWLDDKPFGETPFRAIVPAGHYRLRIENDDALKNESTDVVVVPDETTTVERFW